MPLGASRLSFLAFQAAEAAAGRTPYTITTVGNAQVDTAQYQFGGASALFGNGEDSLRITGGIDQSSWSSTWTFECWFRAASFQDNNYLVHNRGIIWLGGPSRSTHSNEVILALSSAPNTGVSYYVNFSPVSGGWQTNQWYHLAVTHDNGTTEVFVDGTSLGTASTNSYLFTDLLDLDIGKHLSSSGNDFNGHIDEIRISDTVRYTSGFTPSTTAFANDANTKLLIHADGADGSTTFIDDAYSKATGGSFSLHTDGSSNVYAVHTFKTGGTFTPSEAIDIDALIVGGGGGGGNSDSGLSVGGGGGGAQANYQTNISVTAQNYTISIGNGGASATDGNDSTAFGYTGEGGGYGGGGVGAASSQVNSAGGGGRGHWQGSLMTGGTGTFDGGDGFSGNENGGGGGGNGGVGADATSTTGGNGGNGASTTDIFASGTQYYGGGGGGGSLVNTAGTGTHGGGNGTKTTGSAATANTGSGGGGAGGTNSRSGGQGGSGIVIIRYAV